MINYMVKIGFVSKPTQIYGVSSFIAGKSTMQGLKQRQQKIKKLKKKISKKKNEYSLQSQLMGVFYYFQ